jgi:hypothetical protein
MAAVNAPLMRHEIASIKACRASADGASVATGLALCVTTTCYGLRFF